MTSITHGKTRNQLAHKVSKKSTNPWLTTAKEEIMLDARRIRSKSKGPAIFQIAAQDLDFAHVCLPKHCTWVNRQRGQISIADNQEIVIQIRATT